ncbi:OX-2 membrane glycoprotein-like isoform X2 [Centropristis striata]|uniref:OX-2 membrane glycoprotein-like isoform X2 n=1 Tax=Centropristis striata TaxID=184440 RepID=UPI0027DF4DD7|nr:OX-2 membrane glycoprotein-like isoform X2 [Centropristis striata]
MASGAVLCLFLLSGVFQKGLAALIETQQTVLAAVGEEAQLNCQLMKEKDVLKVTWWKILPDEEQNLAMYNKYSGPRVNSDFRDKIEVICEAGLLNCSLVIKNMTEQDEGCYRCLFNTESKDAFNGTTCLRVQELHRAVLQVRASDSPEETVVSCWATGGPAPTVTLTVPHYNSSRVTNSNGTVTVTTTALLSALHHESRQVGCVVRWSSGPLIEVSTIIPADKQSSVELALICSLVGIVGVLLVAASIIDLRRQWRLKQHDNRPSDMDSGETETTQTPTSDTHEVRTSLMEPTIEAQLLMSSGGKNRMK